MKLNEKIYLLDSSGGSFVYLIKGEETMLIDTGLPFKSKRNSGHLRKISR